MTRTGDVITLTLDELAYIGAASREIGYAQAEAEMAARWAEAARPVRRVLAWPTFAELQRRRWAS